VERLIFQGELLFVGCEEAFVLFRIELFIDVLFDPFFSVLLIRRL
jgi:hypothetical protein